MKLVIIIPAYNESKTVGSVIAKISAFIEGVSSKEVIVVNDGSTDNTVKIAKEAGALVVSHTKNRGVGVAFATGVNAALEQGADLVVTIDADNQFDAGEIPKLIGPILSNKADVVLGSRFLPGSQLSGISKAKLVGNKIIAKFISYLCRQKLSDVSCGFRAYSKEALLQINLFGEFTYTHEVILNLTFKNLRIKEVPIKTQYFPERVSSLSGNLFAYGLKILKIIFQVILDYKPFHFFGGLGAFLFLLGIIFDFAVFAVFLSTGSFSDYKFMGAAGLALNIFGLLLFIIGLLASMLNRIRNNQERIIYYLKRKTNE